MDATLIAFAACLLASFGGRAQMTLARLAQHPGNTRGMLAAALVAAAGSTAAMAWAGMQLAALAGPDSVNIPAAAACAMAAIELAWPVRVARLSEPTQSLGAIMLALFARQLFDAPRWLVLAGALLLAQPIGAAAGGAAGTMAALWLGWRMQSQPVDARRSRMARLAMAAAVLLPAGMLASGVASIHIQSRV